MPIPKVHAISIICCNVFLWAVAGAEVIHLTRGTVPFPITSQWGVGEEWEGLEALKSNLVKKIGGGHVVLSLVKVSFPSLTVLFLLAKSVKSDTP